MGIGAHDAAAHHEYANGLGSCYERAKEFFMGRPRGIFCNMQRFPHVRDDLLDRALAGEAPDER